MPLSLARMSALNVLEGWHMTHKQWTTIFLLSFIPLALWLLVWFIHFTGFGFSGLGSSEFIFFIPTVLYVGFQIWLAIRAFKAWYRVSSLHSTLAVNSGTLLKACLTLYTLGFHCGNHTFRESLLVWYIRTPVWFYVDGDSLTFYTVSYRNGGLRITQRNRLRILN